VQAIQPSKRLEPENNSVLGSAARASYLNVLGVVGFLAIWSLIAFSGLVSPLIIPSPMRVLGAVTDVGWKLVEHVAATVVRIVTGFTFGAALGMTLGIAMQYSRRFYLIADGLVETFRPVPPVALVPFFILVFGFAEIGKLLVVTMGVGLMITVTTVEAISRVPTGVIRWGLVSGLHRGALFRLVIFPAAWPEMRTGFRIALAAAVSLVIVSEFMGATYGLGYLISVSKVTLTTPTILLSTMLLGWIGWLLDRALRWLFDSTCRWDTRAKEATR
jgi:sulfonate transport system permease protein